MSLSHVTLLLLHCYIAIVTLLLLHCYIVTLLLLHCYCYIVTLLLLYCYIAIVTLLHFGVVHEIFKTLWLPGIWEKEKDNHFFRILILYCLLIISYKLGLSGNIETVNMLMAVALW